MSDELKEALKISGEDWLSDHEIVIYNAARHWAISTVVCPTCGGSGIRGHYEHVDSGTGEHLGNQPIPCPDCASGRQPNPEVRDRMGAALYQENHYSPGLEWEGLDDIYKEVMREQALRVWLVEHREDT
jgi:hypothetical protein